MNDTSLRILSKKLDDLGVQISVEDGKLKWKSSVSLFGALLDELIERQDDFIAQADAPERADPVLLIPPPRLGGGLLTTKQVDRLLSLLEDFGVTVELRDGGLYVSSPVPLEPRNARMLAQFTDDVYKVLKYRAESEQRRN